MKIGDRIQGYVLTEKIDRGGSDRQFYRCSKNNVSFILIQDKEIFYYLKLHRHLAERGIPVPEIQWFDTARNIMVQEDLGQHSLYELNLSGTALQVVYEKAIDELIRLQFDGMTGIPVDCRYDYEHIRWEQEYFRNYFLVQYCGITEEASHSIDTDLGIITSNTLQSAEPISKHLMHRDFQSQNVYYKDNRIRIIDFQSARIGPLTYDLGALLRDPYANISQQTEQELFDYYHRQIREKGVDIAREELWHIYRLTALQRGMQALGAFANLSLNKGKPRFAEYIPRGIDLLTQLTKDSIYSALNSMMSSVCP